ncbi:transcriptional regulator [Escherichia coli]|nr:transcriptional regulator [Escherichia coli]EKA0308498.1 transcriptional regulator [Escherichia coli]
MINEEQFVKVPMWILKISQVNGHKFTDSAKNLYCYLRGFDHAFPSYAKIGDVFGITPRAAEERVKKLLEMGLIIKDARPGSSNLYRVLDIPKGESSLPDPSEKENESNEILNVSEIIVEEEIQESEFPEKIFNWLLSLDKKKPPHEETEDFVKRALDSKNIYLEKQAFHDLIISLREKSEIYDSIPF